MIFVGCAGWTLPRAESEYFPGVGSHLERYARRFTAVEINSSFKKPHRQTTYRRWAGSVPASFRFSVKLPKEITHSARLQGCEALLDEFLEQVSGLGDKLGCLLVQLPPSFAFDGQVAAGFFRGMRNRSGVAIVCEPRHASWFSLAASDLLADHDISRVAADPPPDREAKQPGGSKRIVYFRLHGSPRVYYSSYDDTFLDGLATQLLDYAASGYSVWCFFDNTTLGAATCNARELLRRLLVSGTQLAVDPSVSQG
jgi:uncharacterized protein YecE (DUF72 family)